MPRPSIKAERSEEILDAYERCIARHGVDGATLERIAEEAGVKRSLIRHYLGNRDELLAALIDRFFARSDAEVAELFDALPRWRRAESLVELLFDPAYADPQSVLVSGALVAEAPQIPGLAERMRQWIEDFTGAIAAELEAAYPEAGRKACAEVAAGVVGIYINVDSLTVLGEMEDFHKASKAAAHRLVKSLTA